jgi:mutator protein MutT
VDYQTFWRLFVLQEKQMAKYKIKITKRKEVASCIILDDQDKILILKRSQTDPWKPGWWDLPGGHVDPGEKPIEGATREADEEANLTVRNLIEVDSVPFDKIIKFFFITTDWEGEVDFKPNPKSGFTEHDDFRWVTIEELEEITNSIIPIATIKKGLELV